MKSNILYVNKYIVGLVLILGIFSIHKIFALDHDISSFSALLSDAPCVDLQYDLRPGSRDYYIYGDVMRMQSYLYQNDMMFYPPTGLYAEYTQEAVMNFQNSVGLRATGIVDYNTRKALKAKSCPQEVSLINNSSINTNLTQQINTPYYQNNNQYTYIPTTQQQTPSYYYCSINGAYYATSQAYSLGCVSTTPQSNYIVSFESNGGTSVTSKTVNSGSTVSQPTDPTKSGYTFAGWYSDSNLTNSFLFSTAVTSNLTLYAKWTANTITNYVVTFIADIGSYSNVYTTQSVPSGSIVTRPVDPAKSGAIFTGWYNNLRSDADPFSFSTPITSNLVLTAMFTNYTSLNTNVCSGTPALYVYSGDTRCNPSFLVQIYKINNSIFYGPTTLDPNTNIIEIGSYLYFSADNTQNINYPATVTINGVSYKKFVIGDPATVDTIYNY